MPCGTMINSSLYYDKSRPDTGELMAGVLDIVQSSERMNQRVFVRVYRTSSEHFAVIYPLRAITTARKPLGSVNLRACSVHQLPSDRCKLRLVPRACDGITLTFLVPGSSDNENVSAWIQALSRQDGTVVDKKRIFARQALLPVLAEEEDGV